ncbi:MAG: cyclic nucleotide-binding domain-containing protein [Treponema sp.]|nr:cyclic nucleotide-binding domain-containing protein [Treponema sp.]MBQ1794969.1 cyclic nucleotide-binding domain-containing protein [Treponema sp.]MBQ2481336.1 cyclic nucleotide-binding domain-containing protein [Treponema sp.]MBQ5450057.1 cyclic nucleotide-binding domain-containing protein [Treponema sp.]
MPKIINYPKNSMIFVEGDKDDRIFILQSGYVILVSTDFETGKVINEKLAIGEFFGVKSSLARVPRQETATVMADSVVVQMTPAEFEKIFSPNQTVMLKMLRVFSRNLRDLHYRTELLLNNNDILVPSDKGMIQVAQAFLDEEIYNACEQVCEKVLARYPYDANKAQVTKIMDLAKREKGRKNASAGRGAREEEPFKHKKENALKQFDLPMFERFSKTYTDGDVIICEYEPGESFYLVQSGQVQLEKLISGSLKHIDIVSPGEFFGEMAILDDSPRSATCIAKGDVRCLEFNKENFRVLVTGNPQIAMILLKLFCKRIYDQKRRTKILVIKDIQARISDIFLMYDEMTPLSEADQDSSKRKFNLTVNDIAHWAGISLDDARDEMNKMSARGKVEIYEPQHQMLVKNINDMKRVVDTYYTIQNARREQGNF